MALKDWVRLPSEWIDAGGLRDLPWGPDGVGSDNTAALMVLVAIAHHAEDETGFAVLTYDVLQALTGLSRAKISNGLDVLERQGIVARSPAGRSTFLLIGYNPRRGWAKLPAKSMYASGRIAAFDEFHLRSRTELNALKLFMLFAVRRGQDTNAANISVERISQYTGVEKKRMKAATSLLANLGLVYTDRMQSTTNPHGVANAYRLVGIDPYTHMGTRGRGMDEADAAELAF